ncbi:sensor domain-containing protein [Bacillus timonensis]|uniref:sensor domain-containing protein n=1 Tax=Bacillus timonensis TaxID=1033734 RepID=UPI000287FBC5|nr:EAL domain-containing protein [Bacillus timonensis]
MELNLENNTILKKLAPEDHKKLKEVMKKLSDVKYAFDQSSIVAITDNRGKITYVNDQFCKQSKFTRNELIGKNHQIINSGYHKQNFFKNMWATIGTGKVWRGEVKNRAKYGSYYWVDTTIVPFLNEKGVPYQYVSIRNDITLKKKIEEERVKSEKMIYRLAYYDTLTDLPNRRLFMDYVTKELQDVERRDSQMGVIFLDIDRLKNINESCGHEIGDLILMEIPHRINQCLHESDVLSRFGGDEFTILLKNASDKSEIERTVNQIIESLQKTVILGERTFRISCSMGIALSPSHGLDSDNLLKRAAIALNSLKERGGNGYLFFDEDMERRSLERVHFENALRDSIQLEEFSIHYQPKIDLFSGRIVGIEALIRWRHPELGLISPAKFIPVAEETGLIIPLGEWILRRACEQNKEWQRKGFPPIRVAVNLSVQQLNQPNLVEKIKQILLDTQLDSKWLELEITESVFADIDNIAPVLQKIRELGIFISIDDFGTGYSSLSYLKRLPADILKIDASFIKDITTDRGSRAIVKAIITFGEAFNLEIIAEGVENKEQLNILVNDGCNHGQGYLYSKPLSAQEIEQYFKKMVSNNNGFGYLSHLRKM